MEVNVEGVPPVCMVVEDRSGVGELRRAATALARQLGMAEEDAGRVALVVTEAANNVVQHGGGGEVVVRPLVDRSGPGVEVLVVDRGPGMSDVARALQDGYSTSGTPGTGLGAVKRIAELFDIYSAAGQGTVLLARVWSRTAEPAPRGPSEIDRPHARGLALGVVSLPRRGETRCGDAWATAVAPEGALVLVADGLGHGPDAATAADAAVRIFRERSPAGPAQLLADMHAALRSTRGAAVAIALLDPERREVRYAGVGNITGTIVAGGTTRSMVSHNGTVGHELRKIQEFLYPWPEHALVVMHSDGLQTHWRLDRYHSLGGRHPGVVAGLLYRDYTRGRDDVTVLSVRESAGGAMRGDLALGGAAAEGG